MKTVSKLSNRCSNLEKKSDICIDSDGLEKSSNIEVQKCGINNFVIVNYEGEYFPGQIKCLLENDGNIVVDYKFTVMAMSQPEGWWWPELEERFGIWLNKWYKESVLHQP